MNAHPKVPSDLVGIEDELAARREAAAFHTVLNGLRSKLALEGPSGEPGPSDAEVMEAIEGATSERVMVARPEARA